MPRLHHPGVGNRAAGRWHLLSPAVKSWSKLQLWSLGHPLEAKLVQGWTGAETSVLWVAVKKMEQSPAGLQIQGIWVLKPSQGRLLEMPKRRAVAPVASKGV